MDYTRNFREYSNNLSNSFSDSNLVSSYQIKTQNEFSYNNAFTIMFLTYSGKFMDHQSTKTESLDYYFYAYRKYFWSFQNVKGWTPPPVILQN